MKFYNKNPKLRNTWTKISPCDFDVIHLKKWCQNIGSDSRFYFKYSYQKFPPFNKPMPSHTVWYFENPEDALLFKLTWQ
jgi:hypothetical protein